MTDPAAQVSVLAISDRVDAPLYDPGVRGRFGHVDMVISCGDLPAYYLDYLASMLNVPVLMVHGNHDEPPPPGAAEPSGGAVNLHARVVRSHGLLLAGLEGSQRYNYGPFQYSEAEMCWQAARIVPRLLWNRLRYGRSLDVLVTHAPPAGIHDQPDRCHRGFQVFRWLLRAFRPRYHLHGHVHVYSNQTVTRSQVGETLVVNVYGHRELRLERAEAAPRAVAPVPH